MAHAFYVQMGGIVSSTAKRGQVMMNGIDALEVPRGKMITSLSKNIQLSLEPDHI